MTKINWPPGVRFTPDEVKAVLGCFNGIGLPYTLRLRLRGGGVVCGAAFEGYDALPEDTIRIELWDDGGATGAFRNVDLNEVTELGIETE